MKQLLVIIALLICNYTIAQQPDKTNDKPKEPDSRGYIVNVGDMAPIFTIQYLDGTSKQLSDLKGKVIMLQFTASWCGVCRKEMPHIEADIWQKHKNNPNFILLGIDLKEKPEVIKKFVEKTGVTYPIVLDPEGEIFAKYAEKNAGVTRNIIIDKTGKISFLTRLFDENEFNTMKAHIDNLLK
ncbi:MAG: TlpA family protein disulfide reductase [Prevotellaceae bacterium]|jgi:peroxiredoxin|nr:TlpA family protein disulfide reductase [Prevotellaceae bacterium]